MTVVFARDEHTGILCGVEDGELFLCNYREGYTMPDTPANRNQLMRDFSITSRLASGAKLCNGCTI